MYRWDERADILDIQDRLSGDTILRKEGIERRA